MAVEVEVLVRQRLLASPEVRALVGTRIFPVDGRPDESQLSTLPAITFLRASTRRLVTHQGSLGGSAPLIQLDCWAKEWSEVRMLAKAVKSALDGWVDYSTDPPIQGVTIEDGELDDFDQEVNVRRFIIPVRVRCGE